MIDEENIYESGVLERYLTGDLSEQESQQVIDLLKRDAALRQHVTEMEMALETIATKNAITPPAEVKKRLFEAIEDSENKSVPSKNTIPSRYLMIAATLTVLLGTLAFWFYNQNQTLQDNIKLVNTQNKELKENIDGLEQSLQEIETTYAKLSDPKTQKYILNGNTSLPGAIAIAYLNVEKKMALLDTAGLPTLPEDKDYQLWADVEGEMISMGVLPVTNKPIAMEFIEDAASINITIEPKGGSDHATVANLVANHYITP